MARSSGGITADSPLINITIRGAGVAIIGGGIYAALITPPNATTTRVAHAGGRRVVEQHHVVPRLQAPGSEPDGQVAQAVLDRVPQLVHDVSVNARRG